MGQDNNFHNLQTINVNELAIKTTESSLFELSHFIEAYRVSSLVDSKISSTLDNAEETINEISREAFSSASDCLELSFTNFLDSSKAKELIDDYINET